MTEEIFKKWQEDHAHEMAEVESYITSCLPDNPALIQTDLNQQAKCSDMVINMVEELSLLVALSRAQELLDVKFDPKYEGFSSPERKSIVDSRIRLATARKERLESIMVVLKARHFSLTGQRATERESMRLGGHQ